MAAGLVEVPQQRAILPLGVAAVLVVILFIVASEVKPGVRYGARQPSQPFGNPFYLECGEARATKRYHSG